MQSKCFKMSWKSLLFQMIESLFSCCLRIKICLILRTGDFRLEKTSKMYLIWFIQGLKSAQRNMCMCLSFSKASRRRKLLLHGFTYSTGKNFLFPKLNPLCATASKKPSQPAFSNVAWAFFILPDPFSSCPGVSPIEEFALYKLPFLGVCHLVPSRVQPIRGSPEGDEGEGCWGFILHGFLSFPFTAGVVTTLCPR